MSSVQLGLRVMFCGVRCRCRPGSACPPAVPQRRPRPTRPPRPVHSRRWTGAAIGPLGSPLGPERHGGRAPAGVFVRTGQPLLAPAAAIRHNWTTNAPERTGQAIPDRLRPT
ncbi:hypothetical protein EYS09_08230 [Streptomyces kasugaensis]|uniref:Uncharacterized protein n=1 Tax=Streptomyces kasugaensis TaxID=1946 RepID=A0A4Q9I0P2_STRKA|nr:hypothetical protein EYS09_08230 [Streptomyces kasugaensis]